MLLYLFGEGRYHLIPSFFKTLVYLKKNKRDFQVLFRTFADDLPAIIFEFNRFCDGEHPCFNGRGGNPLVKFDGSKGTKDFRIKEQQQGVFIRHGTNQATLVMGTLKRDKDVTNYQGDIEEGTVTLNKDPVDQYVQMMETLKKHNTIAIQDDFEPWLESGKHRDYGKLLYVDQADYQTQHIFFDDNAWENEKCNIDVRDLITGDQIKYKKFANMYVTRVEPHRAVVESDYFIKLIEACEQKRDEEIERYENGEASEDEDLLNKEGAQNEWEQLQGLPNEEYLMKTVLPVLYQGMKVVSIERPTAPLDYLAMYLLKNQDKVKLPIQNISN